VYRKILLRQVEFYSGEGDFYSGEGENSEKHPISSEKWSILLRKTRRVFFGLREKYLSLDNEDS
jgi:hypothetical protein